MKGYFFKNRIILLELHPLGGVLTILCSDVPGCTGHATVFVLCALHDYLDAIAFLCHEMFRKTERKSRSFF